jgi:acetolactate synthase-1/2/3 large subunit
VVQQADLIFYVGSEAGGMTTNFWTVPAIGVATIQVDINPEALGRNYPLKAALCGDVKVTMQRMLEHADRSSANRRQVWNETTRSICSEWHTKYQPFLESDTVPIRPERICHELTRYVPDNSIVLADTGHAGMWMGGMYDTRTNTQTYLRSSGHLGWAFSAGLGAKCACPNRPVVVFTGDAGFCYHIAEIETAARRGINTVTIVNNNNSGNQSKLGFDRAYDGQQSKWARELWIFSKLNFARIAEDMGAVGIRVEDPKELPAALQRALKADRPVIIDVVTDPDVVAPPPVK